MRSSRRMSGFTLIELVVVIAIIAIVAAISIPAMHGVRDTSRLTQTRGLIQSLENATSQFRTDNQGRQPGYFSPKEMGSNPNLSAGLSTMNNMLLDLVGGVVDPTTPTGPDILDVAPYTMGSIKVRVDLNKMGTGKYFALPGGSWSTSAGDKSMATGFDNKDMPDLIDAFGTPILAWVEDDAAVSAVKTVTDFAKIDSGSAGTPLSAKFYWAQNSRWLTSTSVGRKLIDQSTESLLGSTFSDQDRRDSLAGILGSPAFPYRDPTAGPTIAPIVAAKGRAPIVFHSAGKDGVFFGKDETGAKQFPTAKVDYKINFVNSPTGTLPGAGYTDKNGNPTNIDVVEKFNDLLVGTGN